MADSIRQLLFGTFSSPNRLTTTDWGLLVLRLGVASLMAFGHGWGKLSTFGERMDTFADPLGVGTALSLTLVVFAEFFCSVFIGLGIFTRLAAIPLATTMAVAVLIIHAEDPWGRKELAMIYLLVYITLMFTGPGRISLDKKLGRS